MALILLLDRIFQLFQDAGRISERCLIGLTSAGNDQGEMRSVRFHLNLPIYFIL